MSDLDRIEGYRKWRSQIPYLYDICLAKALPTPALSAQFVPLEFESQLADFCPGSRLLLCATELLRVNLPDERIEDDSQCSPPNIQLLRSFDSLEDAHKLRWMPQEPGIIAMKTAHASIQLLDLKELESDAQFKGTLVGQRKGGWGIDWSTLDKGLLLSGSSDGSFAVYDINNVKDEDEQEPIFINQWHQEPVNSVSWNPFLSKCFATGSDDRRIAIWDYRQNPLKHSQVFLHHTDEIYTVSFSPLNEFQLAAGSSDGMISICDLRFKAPVLTLKCHPTPINHLAWNPSRPSIFASCSGSSDGRVCIWDLKRSGEAQSEKDAIDGPPELLFLHGGHTGSVSEMDWSSPDNWLVASVSEAVPLVQVWELTRGISRKVDLEE